MGYSEITVVS